MRAINVVIVSKCNAPGRAVSSKRAAPHGMYCQTKTNHFLYVTLLTACGVFHVMRVTMSHERVALSVSVSKDGSWLVFGKAAAMCVFTYRVTRTSCVLRVGIIILGRVIMYYYRSKYRAVRAWGRKIVEKHAICDMTIRGLCGVV